MSPSTPALAQPPEPETVTDASAMGPPNEGLALSAKLVGGEQRRMLGVEAIEVRVANVSNGPILVGTTSRSSFFWRAFVYDSAGRCLSPLAMNSMAWMPVMGSRGAVGPGDSRTPLAPGASAPIWPPYLQVDGLSEQTPPGKYTVVAIAVDLSKGIPSLLISNLVTFDWPRAAE